MRKMTLLVASLAALPLTTSCGSQVSVLSFVSVDPAQPKIGDVTTVTFKLTDPYGNALAGENVRFHLDSDRPGVKLDPTTTLSLKGSGFAQTQLVVTGTVSAVVVVANAGNKEVRSPPISFAGTFASGRGFTFQCGEFSGAASGGVHAIGAYDEARNLIAGVKLNCHAHVADRNGDGIPGAVVSFLAEAGTIGGSGTSVADVIGNADVLLKTSYPLPKEVEPGTFTWITSMGDTQTGDYLVPLWMEPFVWTTNPFATITTGMPPFPMPLSASFPEPRRKDPERKKMDGTNYTNNPRDNLVTLIAFTSGEEGYSDTNNDGKYEEGEPFEDLTEPFVDADDDGTWCGDANSPNPCADGIPEIFVDLNGDGQWTGKNGQWDANTIIWVSEKIIWTGIPDLNDYRNPEPTVRPVQAVNGQPIYLDCNGSAPVVFDCADPWFNSMAMDSDNDGCTTGQTIGPPIVAAAGGQYGRPFTYPPVREIAFTVLDALDRMPAPMSNVPGCFRPPGTQPISWVVPIGCRFTASPVEGHVVLIPSLLTGSSASNYP